MEWVNVAVQAGGAGAVCGMFLWFLIHKQRADDVARKQFLDHLSHKDQMSSENADKQLGYLRERDKQSQTIAAEGHAALVDMANQVRELRLTIEGKQQCQREP